MAGSFGFKAWEAHQALNQEAETSLALNLNTILQKRETAKMALERRKEHEAQLAVAVFSNAAPDVRDTFSAAISKATETYDELSGDIAEAQETLLRFWKDHPGTCEAALERISQQAAFKHNRPLADVANEVLKSIQDMKVSVSQTGSASPSPTKETQKNRSQPNQNKRTNSR